MPGRDRTGRAVMIFSLIRRSVAPGRDSRPVAIRGALSALCAVIAAAAIGATALAAGTQIFDPKTRKWIDYDKTKAWKYYSVHKQVPEAFRRQVVQFRTAEVPGTIIIDGNQHFLYLVMPNKQAMRYGIGVGRDGF